LGLTGGFFAGAGGGVGLVGVVVVGTAIPMAAANAPTSIDEADAGVAAPLAGSVLL
jgi:hypothetical protein